MFIGRLLQHYQPEIAQDVQDMLKDLLGDAFQGMLATCLIILIGTI